MAIDLSVIVGDNLGAFTFSGSRALSSSYSPMDSQYTNGIKPRRGILSPATLRSSCYELCPQLDEDSVSGSSASSSSSLLDEKTAVARTRRKIASCAEEGVKVLTDAIPHENQLPTYISGYSESI